MSTRTIPTCWQALSHVLDVKNSTKNWPQEQDGKLVDRSAATRTTSAVAQLPTDVASSVSTPVSGCVAGAARDMLVSSLSQLRIRRHTRFRPVPSCVAGPFSRVSRGNWHIRGRRGKCSSRWIATSQLAMPSRRDLKGSDTSRR
jgi:hypothetical protein